LKWKANNFTILNLFEFVDKNAK